MLRPVFSWEGKKYHVGLLKVAEVEAIEQSTGSRYVDLMPLGTMRHKVAFMRAFLAQDNAPDKVDAILAGMTLADTDKCWDVEDDDLPEVYQDGVPLVEAGPSTGTS